MQRSDSLEKALILEKTEGKRSGWQKIRLLDSNTNSMYMNLSKLWEIVKDGESGVLQSMGLQRVSHNMVMNNNIP